MVEAVVDPGFAQRLGAGDGQLRLLGADAGAQMRAAIERWCGEDADVDPPVGHWG
jgi:hypothetical protein